MESLYRQTLKMMADREWDLEYAPTLFFGDGALAGHSDELSL